MIQVPSRDLSAAAGEALKRYQAEVDSETDFGRRVELAVERFRRRNRKRNPVFRQVRRTLASMCSGAQRCMYCEDSAADEVEHHRPKHLYPEQVFVWENYLYACGSCNSPKNSSFAVFTAGGLRVDLARRRDQTAVQPAIGDPVLLDPRIENPLDYIMLDILGSTFWFVPTPAPRSREFERASYTIQLLRLNERDHLPVARGEAYESYRARLVEYVHERDARAGQSPLRRMIRAIQRMQHPTVWFEMCRQNRQIPVLRPLFERAPEALSW